MADAAAAGLPVAAAGKDKEDRRRLVVRCAFAVAGIMSTLLVYGVLQEKIMRVPYGADKEFFKHSLFLVFCNRITTSMVSAMVLLRSKKSLDPVAPLHNYGVVSISNILTTTCQYEALKYVSFPIQTLAKCAKMIPVMLVSILLSCIWFVHPLSWMQWVGAAIVFGALYAKSFLRSKLQRPVASSPTHGSSPNSANS